MSASIGICNVSSEYCDLFQSPSVKTTTNIESNIEGVLGPYHVQAILSAVASAEANRPSGIKPTDLSKLCITLETLAECAVKRNTQLMSNKYDNSCIDT